MNPNFQMMPNLVGYQQFPGQSQMQMDPFQMEDIIYQQQMHYWQQQFDAQNLIQPPPKGPYPGTTYHEYDNYNLQQQQEYQRFLKDVADYHKNKIPNYQKAMYEYLNKFPTYTMNEEEKQLMEQYINEQNYNKWMQNQEQQQQKQAEQQPVEPQQQQEKPKERKKLSKKSKAFDDQIAPAPIFPKYPTAPKFISLENFKNLYNQFLNFYQPTTEFTKFPTPEEEKKQQYERNRKKEEQEKKLQEIQKRQYKRQEKPEEQRATGLKEEKVNVEELTVDTNIFIEPDETRQPVNIVFIGHVDAGKSTLCGRILVDAEEISKEDIRKFEQEAKENNRESWWLAYCMDINEEERAKGKTVECGKAQFQTKTKRYTLLDAPGHANYVPNMIMGASQADLAGLIISAKTGEFESGFEKGGQTQEHALLAQSLGVQHAIIIITKMETVNWDKKRYDEIEQAVNKFVKENCQFKSVDIIPIDALVGDNCSQTVDPAKCNWYKGPTLMQLLDTIDVPRKDPEGPIRIPVLDKLRDQGLFVFGKVESGTIVDGLNVSLYPKKTPFQIVGIYNSKDQRMKYAKAGENVKLKVKNIEDDDIQRGNVICNLESNPCPISQEFQVRMRLLDLPEHKRILSQGYTCVLHLHCCVEEVEVGGVDAVIDPETKNPIKQQFLKSNTEGIVKLLVKNPLSLEKAETITSLGRFALRDEGRTIAFGSVLKIKPYVSAQKQQVLTQK